MNYLPVPTQCTARAKSRIRVCDCNGNRYCDKCRCRNKAILGGTVCDFHGGGAPQVKHAADKNFMAQLERLRTKVGDLSELWVDEQIHQWNLSMLHGTPPPLLDPKAMKDILVALDNQIRLNQGKATEITETKHSNREDEEVPFRVQWEIIQRRRAQLEEEAEGAELAEEVER